MPDGLQSVPIYKKIDTAAQLTTLVTGVPGRRMRIQALFLSANAGPNSFALRNVGTISTFIFGSVSVPDDNHFVLPYSSVGWGETAVGEGIELLLTFTTSVGGVLVYVEVE